MKNSTDRLSEYLDGELDPAETAAIEARLAGDAELRALLEELRAVRAAAGAIPILEAPAGLWAGVRDRISADASSAGRDDADDAVGGRHGARQRRRTLMFTIPQFAIAAGIMLLLGVGLARMADFADRTRPAGPGGATTVATMDSAGLAPRLADAAAERENYTLFVEDLEGRLDAGRGVLDAKTVRVLEESLSKIDSAIGQARTALQNDPNNTYLNQHLASARARKLRLLEDATALVAART